MNQKIDPVSMDSFNTFGEMLKYLRRREQLTQLELSIKVGYSEAQISRLEKSQRLPDPTSIKALFIPALHLEDDPQFAARLIELAQSARQVDAPSPGMAPYKGLVYFDEADADLFFGRDALTSQLVRHVMDLTIDASTRFLAVVGASGSGKSSLVRAGLAVALRKVGWEVVVFTPNMHPLQELEARLSTIHPSDAQRAVILVDQFEEVFTLCREEIERITFIEKIISIAREKSRKLSVVVALRADFYAHCSQYPLLRQAVAGEQEYIGQMSLEELRLAIEEPARRNNWELEPGLVDVMLQDLSTHGSHEPEPGALPLLSHALLATWEHRRGRVLTLSGYHASGGVRGAIAETAESVFTDQLNQAQQEIAREVFLRLTELGEGTEDTRRRAALAELGRQYEQTAQFRAVLNTLAEARLITLNEDSAEVAHEALIREWERLHEWLTQDREGLLLHRHLTEAAQEWERREWDVAELYRGARLAQASEWAAANPDRLNQAESDFLAASLEQEQHEASEREAQRQKELEAAQSLAEAEKQRAEEQQQAAQRLRRRAYQLGGVLAAAMILAAMAILFERRASLNTQLATSRELAAAAMNNLDVDQDRSLLLAMQAVKTADLPEAENALHKAVQNMRLRDTLIGHTGSLYGITYAPHVPSQPDRFATGSDDGTIKIWEMDQTGRKINPEPQLTITNTMDTQLRDWTEGYTIAFINNGSQIVGISDKTIKIWDASTGELVRTLYGHTNIISSFDISPDGLLLATGGIDYTVKIWDLRTGKELQTLTDFTDQVLTVKFSPDGKLMAAGGWDGIARVWTIKGTPGTSGSLELKPAFSFEVGNWIGNMAFSRDGSHLAISQFNIKVFNITSDIGNTTPELLLQIPAHTNFVDGLLYNQDGTQLISGSADGTIKVWDAITGQLLYTLPGNVYGVGSIALDSTEELLLAANYDATVKLWDLSPTAGQEWITIPDIKMTFQFILGDHLLSLDKESSEFVLSQITSLGAKELSRVPLDSTKTLLGWGIDQDLTTFAYIYKDDLTVHLLEFSSGKEQKSFSVEKELTKYANIATNPCYLQLSSGNKYLAIGGGSEGTITLWDAQTGKFIRAITEFKDRFSGADPILFSPDGSLLAAANLDGRLCLWSTDNGNLVHTFPNHSSYFPALAFSLDGSFLLAPGEGTTYNLWDIYTGENLLKIQGYISVADRVSISDNNKYLAIARIDDTIQVFDSKTGKELLNFPGYFADFTPDNKHLLAVRMLNFDVYGYTLDINELMDLARTRLTRTWTQDECVKFLHTETCPPTP